MSNISLVLLVSVLSLASTVYCLRELPSYFPLCYKDDPNLNQCLLKATETVKPFLVRGVPELNIPSISPLHIPEIVLSQGTDTISVKVVLNNVTITGFDTYKFDNFNFDPESLRISGEVRLGQVELNGTYSIHGKVLAIPLEGSGAVDMVVESSNGSLIQDCQLVTKKGLRYLEPVKTILKIDANDNGVRTKFSGLFGENKAISEAIKTALKENRKEIIEETKPTIEEVVKSIFLNLFEKSVGRISYDRLFLVHGQNLA